MSEPVTPTAQTPVDEVGQTNERAIRQKRRETMAKIEEQYKSLSSSIESKFGDLNASLDAVNEKFGRLITQQEKLTEIFEKNSTELNDLKNELQNKEQRITTLEEQMKEMSSRIDQCEEKFGESERQFLLHSEMLCQQNDKFEKIEHNSKAHSLIIKNIPETEKTPSEDIDELFNILKIDLTTEKDCDKIYRIGKPQNRRNAYARPILVQLVKETHKGSIYSSIFNLKDSKLSRVIIDNDQGAVMQRQSGNLRAVAAVAKRQGMKAQVKPGRVIINDTPYHYDKIKDLPPQISLENIKTVKIPDIGICYQGEFSPFSNMHPCEVMYDGEIYKTAEHALVGTRAKVEENTEMEAMVKFTKDPFLVKFKAQKWEESQKWQAIKMDCHQDILYAKFNGNHHLRKALLDTGDETLFECTMDKTFGIGLTLAQRHKIRKNGNPGRNLHGKACMKVRHRIKEEAIAASSTADISDSE